MPHAIGLDIGGTSMVAGVIDADTGAIVSRLPVPTDSRQGIEDGLRRIGDLVDRAVEQAGTTAAQTVGIGIGSTGPADSYTGRINNPYTLPGWDSLPIVDYLVERFKLPAYLLGDCHAAVLGEHWVGAAQDAQHVLYMTAGTGIGGGIIVDGKLYRGAGLLGGEVGHHVIDLNGPPCYCGARGCLEMLAAGPAIARRAAENAPADSLLLTLAGGDAAQITAALVAQAAGQGDAYARQVMDRTAYYFGVGVANLINIVTPEIVVLGGGVMKSWDMLAPILLDTVRQRATLVPAELVKIVPASLSLNAGITGAARAILDYLAGKL